MASDDSKINSAILTNCALRVPWRQQSDEDASITRNLLTPIILAWESTTAMRSARFPIRPT
jgi:hypothetical protein